jgi:hypothetical protein
VIAAYPKDKLIQLAQNIGLTPEQLNSSFHKSWAKVRSAPLKQLIIEQMIHYLTTYGFEARGIYSDQTIYIPGEELEIPDIVPDNMPLVVICGITKEELKKMLLQLITSGIAIQESTLHDLLDIALYCKLDDSEISSIANKEIRIALYDHIGIIPADPAEFLRLVIYKATEKTLLIKSKDVLNSIHSRANFDMIGLFEQYQTKYGLESLAEIFYRFKPIFLALRTNRRMKTFINKIRRHAYKCHIPMDLDILDNVTSRIKRGKGIRHWEPGIGDTGNLVIDVQKALRKANIFRKIRLAYALNYRLVKPIPSSIVYRIRNGTAYATELNFPEDRQNTIHEIYGMILDSIASDMSLQVANKSVYIPDNVEYALPATEKMFTGYYPTGSCIILPDNMLLGVWWQDVKKCRIDLDLSLLNAAGDKCGWDASYRTNQLLFSGDITAAPHGAAEWLYARETNMPATYLLVLNWFNYQQWKGTLDSVPFKLIIASDNNIATLDQNYIVDPNNVIDIIESTIKGPQKILGVLEIASECRFYFAEMTIGKANIARTTPYQKHAIRYLANYYTHALTLRSMLVLARSGFA